MTPMVQKNKIINKKRKISTFADTSEIDKPAIGKLNEESETITLFIFAWIDNWLDIESHVW